MKGNSGFQIGTGVTSILMIFVVLCLTTFSILSYTSADADLELNQKNSDNIHKFYNAYSKLNKELADIDSVAARLLVEEKDNGEYGLHKVVLGLELRIAGEVKTAYVLDGNAIHIEMSVDMNDKQKLIMEATINTDNVDNRCIVEKCYVYTENNGFSQEETLPDMWGG